MLIPTPDAPGPAPVVDPDFHLSSWQEQSLLDLIQMVKESTMNEAPKVVVVQELETLLTTLREVQKESGMKTAVVACITNVSRTVTDYDTYLPIANLLKASSDPTVKALGGAIATLSLTTEGELNGIRDQMLGLDAPADTKTKLNALYLALSDAMATYNKSNTDPLYLTVMNYIGGLSTISQNMDGTSWPTQELTDLTSSVNTNMTLALMQQHVNEDVKTTVVQKLMQMFGISKNDLPKDVVNSGAGSGGLGETDGNLPDPDGPLQGGGVADGDILYNSNDLVYDPETNTYVTYGTLLNAAYGKFLELKNQGALTPEEEKLIADYFNRLYSIQPNP
jgi:peroxiredoxin family protein